jgi:glucose/arabinose dehydrogenase
MRRAVEHLLLSVFLAVTLAAGAEAQIRLHKIAGNLASPVDIAAQPNSSSRLYFVLQGGRIVLYNGTRVLATPFLNLASSISCCGERGLLSLAFHPKYANNGFFYVLYTAPGGDVTLARFKVSSSNRNVANAGSKLVLLTIPHSQNSNHNGGKLLFGKDGYLYVSVGDGGGADDPDDNGQDLGTLLGKLLRIDVNGATPYRIPASNPFVGVAGARAEIWAYGLRNLWRFSFDRSNGNLYLADVGQNDWEEISFQAASSDGGENYGWRRMEGRHCFEPANGCNDGTLELPILEYGHATGCSITGGYVYRGAQIPAIVGKYLYADFCDGVIRGAKKVSGVWTTSALLATGKRISTFGQDRAGELYVAEHGAAGAVYRIVKQ